jgi:hypothetical protein
MYEKISCKEINETAQYDPMRAMLMFMANGVSENAKEKTTLKKHIPTLHNSGWSILIETDNGVVGIWSCWLDDKFFIGYPLDFLENIDNLILNTLQVKKGTIVKQDCFGELRDRKWAKFCSNQYEGYGRVWIEYDKFNSNGYHFKYINNKKLNECYYGHNNSYSINTFPFGFYSENAPDSPTSKPEIIQQYRDKFIDLGIKIAKRIGQIKAINIDYGFVIVPEQLITLDYSNIEYIKGSQEIQEGWGGTEIYAKKDNEEIILKSGNSLVPWSSIRRISVEDLNVETVLKYLTF